MTTAAGGVTAQRDARPRNDLREFLDLHAGGTVVVCGCGRSLAALAEPRRFTTVGVNDVGRRFDPDYLVVLNGRGQFPAARFESIERSRARAVFTHLDLDIPHPRVVRFALGQRGGVYRPGAETLPYTRNSPYVAVCLALHMGAGRIGLIGVDFTDDHFFGRTGAHPLSRDLARIDREYGRLARDAGARGVEIVNLSRESRLTMLPKVDIEEFAAARDAPRAAS